MDLLSVKQYTIYIFPWLYIFSELLSIATCMQSLNDFMLSAFELFSRMIAQAGNRKILPKQLRKAFDCCSDALWKFGKTHEEINNSSLKYTLEWRNLKPYP